MGAVPRDITTQPHLCLTWAIGECSMQGEGWAGWGTGQMARGFLTQSESRAPQGRARYRPRGWGQRCSGLPVLAGAQRGSGTCRAPVAPWDTVVWQGWGLGRLCSGVPCPWDKGPGGTAQAGAGHQGGLGGMGPVLPPARASHQGGLGGMGPVLPPARACGPFKPVDTSAQTLSWQSPRLPFVHCSQTLPLLPPTSLTPSPTGPSSRRLLPRSPSPVLPPTQPCSAPFSPASSRPWLRQSPSSWLCWPSSTG